MSRARANIGLVLSGAARDAVAAALMQAGYEVHIAASDARVRSMVARESVDGWVFDARSEDVLDLLLTTGCFLLPADNIPDPDNRRRFSSWVRGLIEQLDAAFSNVRSASGARKIDRWNEVRGVWLLAGSAGATSAVAGVSQRLYEAATNCLYLCPTSGPGAAPPAAQLYSAKQAVFTVDGGRSTGAGTGPAGDDLASLQSHRKSIRTDIGYAQGMGGEHTPDINELLAILSAAKLPSCGIIVFSGMGDDGAGALRMFSAGGGRIWAQSPESAISPAMPRAAIATGLVQRIGDPATLAAHLACLYQPD